MNVKIGTEAAHCAVPRKGIHKWYTPCIVVEIKNHLYPLCQIMTSGLRLLPCKSLLEDKTSGLEARQG
jgi:hypothetical protein